MILCVNFSGDQVFNLGAGDVRGHADEGDRVAGGDRHEADQGGVQGDVQERRHPRRRRRHLLRLQGHVAGLGRERRLKNGPPTVCASCPLSDFQCDKKLFTSSGVILFMDCKFYRADIG